MYLSKLKRILLSSVIVHCGAALFKAILTFLELLDKHFVDSADMTGFITARSDMEK